MIYSLSITYFKGNNKTQKVQLFILPFTYWFVKEALKFSQIFVKFQTKYLRISILYLIEPNINESSLSISHYEFETEKDIKCAKVLRDIAKITLIKMSEDKSSFKLVKQTRWLSKHFYYLNIYEFLKKGINAMNPMNTQNFQSLCFVCWGLCYFMSQLPSLSVKGASEWVIRQVSYNLFWGIILTRTRTLQIFFPEKAIVKLYK